VTDQTKTCRTCKSDVPLSEFSADISRSDGLCTHCKPCDNARRRAREQGGVPMDRVRQTLLAERREWQAERRAMQKQVADAAATVKAVEAKLDDVLNAKPQRAPTFLKRKADRSDATALVLLSDWHVEERVRKSDVNGVNEFSLDIARERAERFFLNVARLTDIAARDSRIETIYLAVLGDLFTGHLHEENLHTTALAPPMAARYAGELLTAGVRFLLDNTPYRLEGVMIPGNHGRMTKKMWMSSPVDTSLESFMYAYVAHDLNQNKRVNLKVAPGAMEYHRFYESFDVRFLHGYEMKYGGGVGGITIPVRKAIAQWDKVRRASLTVFGHFHHFMDGGDFLANGSLIGYSGFGQAIKADYEEPKQAWTLIHARNGGQKALTAPVWVTP